VTGPEDDEAAAEPRLPLLFGVAVLELLLQADTISARAPIPAMVAIALLADV